MAGSNVYEVVERTYITNAIARPDYDYDMKEPFANSRVFYTELREAKLHVNHWAKVNGAQLSYNGRKASVRNEMHHNDWDTERPEYEIKEIEILKHELRGYFWSGRTA